MSAVDVVRTEARFPLGPLVRLAEGGMSPADVFSPAEPGMNAIPAPSAHPDLSGRPETHLEGRAA
jgi:hypothetical protein